jgi:hypothetical protein
MGLTFDATGFGVAALSRSVHIWKVAQSQAFPALF